MGNFVLAVQKAPLTIISMWAVFEIKVTAAKLGFFIHWGHSASPLKNMSKVLCSQGAATLRAAAGMTYTTSLAAVPKALNSLA